MRRSLSLLLPGLLALCACDETRSDENLGALAENELQDLGNGIGQAAEDTVERAENVAEFTESQADALRNELDDSGEEGAKPRN